MEIFWEDGALIRVRTDGAETVLSANREGLLSLSKHFAALAEEAPGTHLHYDAYNSLEEGSSQLIVEVTEEVPE